MVKDEILLMIRGKSNEGCGQTVVIFLFELAYNLTIELFDNFGFPLQQSIVFFVLSYSKLL